MLLRNLNAIIDVYQHPKPNFPLFLCVFCVKTFSYFCIFLLMHFMWNNIDDFTYFKMYYYCIMQR